MKRSLQLPLVFFRPVSVLPEIPGAILSIQSLIGSPRGEPHAPLVFNRR